MADSTEGAGVRGKYIIHIVFLGQRALVWTLEGLLGGINRVKCQGKLKRILKQIWVILCGDKSEKCNALLSEGSCQCGLLSSVAPFTNMD